MSRGRARSRRDAGVQPGNKYPSRGADSRQTRVSFSLGRTRSAVLIRKLAGCKPEERDGIREYLRRDGSNRALDLLDELERRWDGEPS